MRPIILIPARMASERFPGKPLAEIGGKPMIEHVWRSAVDADFGPVIVASPDPEILKAVQTFGGTAVETKWQHASGSDRIHEALKLHDPEGAYDIAVNLQGDLPSIDPESLRAVLAPFAEPATDIATLAVEQPLADINNPTRVKIAGTLLPTGFLRALYFSRAPIPWSLASGVPGSFHHHIGVYAFRRTALERFAALPPSPLEHREKLEQLRALEAGMRIDAALVDTCPVWVDTPEQLQHARDLLEKKWTS